MRKSTGLRSGGRFCFFICLAFAAYPVALISDYGSNWRTQHQQQLNKQADQQETQQYDAQRVNQELQRQQQERLYQEQQKEYGRQREIQQQQYNQQIAEEQARRQAEQWAANQQSQNPGGAAQPGYSGEPEAQTSAGSVPNVEKEAEEKEIARAKQLRKTFYNVFGILLLAGVVFFMFRVINKSA